MHERYILRNLYKQYTPGEGYKIVKGIPKLQILDDLPFFMLL